MHARIFQDKCLRNISIVCCSVMAFCMVAILGLRLNERLFSWIYLSCFLALVCLSPMIYQCNKNMLRKIIYFILLNIVISMVFQEL